MPTRVTYRAYGTTLAATFPNDACRERLSSALAAHWCIDDRFPPRRTLNIVPGTDVSGNAAYDLMDDETYSVQGADGATAAAWLNRRFEYYLGEFSDSYAFLHAGVVSWRSQAIVLPGRGRAGKSTLTAALVRAGAAFCGDNWAVIDQSGCVRAVTRPPRLRADVASEYALPTAPIEEPVRDWLRVAAILFVTYRPNAMLELQPMTRGAAAAQLISNCLNARRYPDLVLRHTATATIAAWSAEGIRGDANDAAARILDRIAT